jgi:hypothetical protein
MHNGEVLLEEPMAQIEFGDADSLQSHYIQTVLNREDAGVFEQTLVE